ncbi:receptor-type tyrosine-protein phosphatase mu isoform X1 [Harpegnathos saltator]|uniref:receptor-type tyrosine-protein phosphatase mu isoform X1 n=1 Tax=Harpegnathos saltator TaxID=610380 RepID=UPI000DBEDB3B|nr:receptor-type tyrosine-protein phosphatase mu isoform X1 [Harpegnathos saltator]
MSRTIIDVLVLSFLVNYVIPIFGNLTTLRGPTINGWKKVICLSEDDGGALVWNSDLRYSYHKTYIIDTKAKKFSSTCDVQSSQIDCKLNDINECLNLWDKDYWQLVTSLDKPMGPVFDERWEEFPEYYFHVEKMLEVRLLDTNMIQFSFSVRAEKDVHVLICNNSYQDNLCYWVIIGGWFNTRSVIRKCLTGMPSIGTFPPLDSPCAIEHDKQIHTALDPYEWRTFVITWNSATRNVSLYDPDKLILTYMDSDIQRDDISFNSKLYIRCSPSSSVRYHDYSYFYTSQRSAILQSNSFILNTNAICLQMLIGLCAECDADVSLHVSFTDEVLENVIVKGSSVAALHGLPMWQSVKIIVNSSIHAYNSLKIVVTPKLNLITPNPIWAIANVRRCPLKGCLRQSGVYIKKDWIRDRDYFWPNLTCQKLFYEEHTIVHPLYQRDLNVKLVGETCPLGSIGPDCKIQCKNALETRADCKAVVICYDNGCTCPAGYVGPKCGASCDANLYGHACAQSCGSCLHNKTCDRVTGECTGGCANSINFVYAPPLCQIGIDKPSETQIIFTNQTTIIANAPIKWEEKYERVELLYSFEIKTPDGSFKDQQQWNTFQDSTQLVGIFANLQPGTTYQIRCILSINESILYADWINAITDCNLITNFHITPNETSLEISVDDNENQMYPCPLDSYVVLYKKNDDESDGGTPRAIPYFPYTLISLTPYTTYNVIISHGTRNVSFERIRTHEGVPSEILTFQAMPLSSSQVSLLWTPPGQPNGEIKEYVVYLKLIQYFGCPNHQQPSQNNYTIVERTDKTKVTLSELHAYAMYDVLVVAYNSRHSSEPARTTFHMNASMIPAVTFSKVKIQNWILSWSLPEDCTAILGPLEVARIEIQGVSEGIKNFNVTKNTQITYIDLHDVLYGAERYVAKIFALRDFGHQVNTSAYIEYEFDTPSKAPPKVNNLEVVEIDDQKNIYLRWQRPTPPLNGVLSNYGIILCHKYYTANCHVIRVQLDENCELYTDYICKSFIYANENIQVVAYNVVSSRSSPVPVTNEMLSDTTPDAPRNFTISVGHNSVIDMKWFHPWRTGGRLLCFKITIVQISSYLTNNYRRSAESMPHKFDVMNYQRNYSMQLFLLPSTQYNISIISVTTKRKNNSTSPLNFWTPSTINFNGDVTFDVHESDITISVNVPSIVNDTLNSILYIVVKGPNPCKNYLPPRKDLWEQAGMKKYDIAWQAVAVSTSTVSSNGMVFTLGNGETHDNATNCPLKSGELYNILVIIRDSNFPYQPITVTREVSRRIGEPIPTSPQSWLIPILIIIIVVVAAVYFYRRRKQQKSNKQLMLQDEMALSQNIETYEHDAKSVISDSKQAPSTPSDRQSLSRATTPDVPTIEAENNDEEKEMISLMKVKDFEDYVRQAIESGLLDKQYETFPRGQTQSWDYGKLPQNKTKNRYGNLIAYDETRVILKKLPDDAHSDYINANYITGYKKKKRYIATQGPKPNTVVDFWRMIWQEKVLIICMLANVIENGKTKCEQYWPDIGKKKKYGEIIVLNATHNVFADYCFRTLHITYEKETRKVEHLHYTAWPDHGVPLYTHSVVTYLKKLLATPPGDGPVVVHCSAGVGRTGTIILCDICLHRAAAEGVVDVFAETASIRRERANMVDNKQQYLLAHLALVECLLIIPTTLPCNETLPTRIKELKKQLPVQQQRLQDTAWQDEALRPVTSPLSLSERNRAKNRFPELISDKVSRIYLKRYPASDEDSDYLSAVYVDGVRLQNQYLATQLPLPSTINDFWRMIAEFKVELIVMLQQPDPEDSSCCAIAPASGEFKPTPYLNITAKEIVESENYTSQKLLLIDNSEKPPREQSVTILCCTEWKPGRNQPPPSVMTMVTFWQATERIARASGPTVTLCHDGVTGCGLYLALSFMLERMAVERECDVCLAVRAVRRSRPDFVRSVEYLEYLYDAALTYLEYFETYANFS